MKLLETDGELIIGSSPSKTSHRLWVVRRRRPTGYGQYYRVPDDYIGRRVWTKLKGETLFTESAKKVIAHYQIEHDRLDEPG